MDRLSALQWATGNSPASRITGYLKVESNGPKSGPLMKLLKGVVKNMNVEVSIMKLLKLKVVEY